MSERQPLTTVVVVGRDVDLWLVVNSLVRALRPAGVRVTAVELPTRLDPAHISATQPALEALHSKLSIEESALLRLTGGSFSLGQNFVSPGQEFFHAWAGYGAPIEGEEFLFLLAQSQAPGLPTPAAEFLPHRCSGSERAYAGPG